MKRVIKRIIEIFLILIVVLSIVEGFREVDQGKVNRCIEDYYKGGQDEAKVMSLKELGNRRHGMFVNEYALVKIDNYKNEEGRKTIDSSRVYPVKFKLISLFGYYKITFEITPDDGELYDRSLKKTFPKEIIEDLKENHTAYVEELNKSNKEKLEQITKKLK